MRKYFLSKFTTNRCRLVHVSVAVLGADEKVIEKSENVLERWPFLRILLPAVQHQLEHRVRALDVRRLWHPVTALNLFDYLAVLHARVGHCSVRDQFVQENSVAPDVALDGKLAKQCCLGGGPENGKERVRR